MKLFTKPALKTCNINAICLCPAKEHLQFISISKLNDPKPNLFHVKRCNEILKDMPVKQTMKQNRAKHRIANPNKKTNLKPNQMFNVKQ